MGKLAVVADLHLGPKGGKFGRIIEDRLMLTVQDLLKQLREDLVQNIVFAGDTFDRVLLLPRFVSQFKNLLHEYWCQGMRFTFISGNHEHTEKDGRALEYLPFSHECVFVPSIVAKDYGSVPGPILAVPYIPARTAEEVILEAVSLAQEKSTNAWECPKIMIGHFGIYDEKAPKWLVEDKQAVFVDWLAKVVEDTFIEVIVVGHHHTAAFYTRGELTIFQVGALFPRSFADSGLKYGNVAIINEVGNSLVCNTHPGYVSGVRYLTEDSPECEYIPEHTMNTSWYITDLVDCVGDEHCEVVNNPETVYDIEDGAVTFIDRKAKKHMEESDRPVLECPQAEEATQAFIEGDKELRSKPGLLSEAISGVRCDLVAEEKHKPRASNSRLRRMIR
jgi:DNA repair exonuclease SbcCD nuclease subunit